MLLEEGDFYHVPFLSGFVSNEGKLFLNGERLLRRRLSARFSRA